MLSVSQGTRKHIEFVFKMVFIVDVEISTREYLQVIQPKRKLTKILNRENSRIAYGENTGLKLDMSI